MPNRKDQSSIANLIALCSSNDTSRERGKTNSFETTQKTIQNFTYPRSGQGVLADTFIHLPFCVRIYCMYGYMKMHYLLVEWSGLQYLSMPRRNFNRLKTWWQVMAT
jgi:hypothetical protein